MWPGFESRPTNVCLGMLYWRMERTLVKSLHNLFIRAMPQGLLLSYFWLATVAAFIEDTKTCASLIGLPKNNRFCLMTVTIFYRRCERNVATGQYLRCYFSFFEFVDASKSYSAEFGEIGSWDAVPQMVKYQSWRQFPVKKKKIFTHLIKSCD
jgi:hypothetical protein